MKTLKISAIFAIAILSFFSNDLNAQSKAKTDTSFIVNGVCMMCQHTIESAAFIDGVYEAKWDVETKVLALSFDAEKTSMEEVNKAVNASGYDSEFATADEKAYEGLHGCCKYRDPKVVEDHR